MTQSNRISPDHIPQSMTLHDDYVPGVLDGAYRLVVQQSVQYGEQKSHYYQDRRFVVVGPRYALPPDDIQARFPPANAVGDYKHILPHIVLRKRGLPWERPLWGTGKEAEPPPWLTLLVLTQAEIDDAARHLGSRAAQNGGDPRHANPLLATTSPQALVSPPDSQIARPDGGVTLLPALDEEGDGDDTRTQVRVVDLPLDLFRSVCPAQADLLYLAHVRTVDPQDKVPLNMHAVGDCSVLTANRFPQPGSNMVLLVSLEGWGALLDGQRELPEGADRVRLVLFDSWTFNDDEAGVHTFGELMQELEVAPLCVAATSDDATVDAALHHGYVPLSYQPWRSAPTFGWYRGPFSPTPVAPLGVGVGLFHRADAALLFDETSGLFDLSYAAAWQLGRLTALSAPSVARDLRFFLDQHHDAFAAAGAIEAFLELHSAAVGRVWDQEMVELHAQLASLDDPVAHQALLEELQDAGYSKAQLDLLAKRAPPPTDGDPPSTDSRIEAADTLLHFFARLALLYPVPTDYMVGHPSVLPPETMRFFYVDNNWLDALLEGALSIALDCARDGQVAVTARQDLHSALSRLVYQYRRHLQGLLEHLDPLHEPPATYIDDIKSGFLLRSAVITGWPGLEVACYDGNLKKLPVLRMDHLGDDLMLCVAAGEIRHVVIREPGEGLRFGVDHDAAVMLRHWKQAPFGAPIQVGHQEHKLTIGAAYLRAGAAAGVLDIKRVADALAVAVNGLEDSGTGGFGPAAFALQMTRSPEKQQIDVGEHTEHDMIEEIAYDE